MLFLASVPLETADYASPQTPIPVRDGFAPAADFTTASRRALGHPRVLLFDGPTIKLADAILLYSYTYRLHGALEKTMLDRRTPWVNLPSIDRAAPKSSVTPVRCRSFQRLCKARLHRRFFFFFFFFRDVASARIELIR